MNTCKSCKYFTLEWSRLSAIKQGDGIGECRKHAPKGPVALGWAHQGEAGSSHAAIMSPFPFVPDDDWCGDYASR